MIYAWSNAVIKDEFHKQILYILLKKTVHIKFSSTELSRRCKIS